MNYQGQELISRATYTSGRSLVALSMAVIFIHWFNIDVSGFSLLNVDLKPAENAGMVGLIVAFLAVGHCVQWYGDKQSFQAWNRSKKVGGGNPRGSGGEELPSELSHLISEFREIVHLLKRKKDDGEGQSVELTWKGLVRDQGWVLEQLEVLQRGIDRLSWYMWAVLYVWHLFVPLGLAGYAMLLLLRSSP